MDTINLVMSLTGAKYTREQISQAIEHCDGDPDDAIEYLNSSRQQEMFSAKAVQNDQPKRKAPESSLKPQRLQQAEESLQGSDFDRILKLQNCECDDYVSIVSQAQ